MNLASLSRKKLLVTGASGFIGSHLCRSLYSQGIEVHAISRSPKSGDDTNIRWWSGDLQDASSVKAILNEVKPDVIYHLASHVTGSRLREQVLPTLYNNFISTVHLLETATEIGCSKIVLAGSLEEPHVSEALTNPSSPYAAAKWASSSYARMFHALYETPVVIARIFMVYGPGQASRFLIPSVISSFLQEESPQLTSGKRPVDWIYVDDLVAGLLAIATVPGLEGQTIDLGSGTLATIREVIEHLVDIINPIVEPAFGAIADRPMEQVRVADSTISFEKLGWKAETSLKEGLSLTTNYYREQIESREQKTLVVS
jgi:UDP-glucose 4-epimerase